jgi:dTDP-3-amino-3,4,6-trideoxy-alpha-D-glucose transaminase
VASGLDAIEISLRALGCKAGDKVLTTPISAFATTLAILKLGAAPVFVDTDDYGLIDFDACERLLPGRSDIRFFVPVHLYGHALDPGRIGRMRERFGVAVVEDCAQSIGARFGGRATGSAGSMAATSFYPTKNLGALGDGGAVLTDGESLAAKARTLRDYGQSAKYVHDETGYNSRLDELQAAILRRAHLPRLAHWTEVRRRVARLYDEGISNAAAPAMGSPVGSESCRHLYPVLVEPARKGEFRAWLQANGIASGEHYPTPIPVQKALSGVPFEAPYGFANATRICASEVSLPIHPYLTDDEAGQVIRAVNSWRG